MRNAVRPHPVRDGILVENGSNEEKLACRRYATTIGKYIAYLRHAGLLPLSFDSTNIASLRDAGLLSQPESVG
jgi:hypothetical protein